MLHNIQNNHLTTQPCSLSPHYCLTNVLPDRCSTGPAIPGVVSHESGDYWTMPRSFNRPVRSHRAPPECRYRPNWLPPTPPESPVDLRPSPTSYFRTALSAHSLTLGIRKYVRAFTVPLSYCPGFHRTAVILSGLSPYRCSKP